MGSVRIEIEEPLAASRLRIPYIDMTEDEWAAERERAKAL